MSCRGAMTMYSAPCRRLRLDGESRRRSFEKQPARRRPRDRQRLVPTSRQSRHRTLGGLASRGHPVDPSDVGILEGTSPGHATHGARERRGKALLLSKPADGTILSEKAQSGARPVRSRVRARSRQRGHLDRSRRVERARKPGAAESRRIECSHLSQHAGHDGVGTGRERQLTRRRPRVPRGVFSTPSRRASPGADDKRRGRGQWVSTVVDTFR